MAKVKVKLNARCLVDSEEREAGEIVEVDDRVAEFFGKPVSKAEAEKATAADTSKES